MCADNIAGMAQHSTTQSMSAWCYAAARILQNLDRGPTLDLTVDWTVDSIYDDQPIDWCSVTGWDLLEHSDSLSVGPGLLL